MLLPSSPDQEQLTVIPDSQTLFHRSLYLRQVPGIAAQVVYGGIILQKANPLYIQSHGIPGSQDDPGMDREPDGRPSADKRDSSIHDNQVGFDRNVHLRGPLRHEQVVVSVKEGAVGQVSHAHRELQAHGESTEEMGLHRGQVYDLIEPLQIPGVSNEVEVFPPDRHIYVFRAVKIQEGNFHFGHPGCQAGVSKNFLRGDPGPPRALADRDLRTAMLLEQLNDCGQEIQGR